MYQKILPIPKNDFLIAGVAFILCIGLLTGACVTGTPQIDGTPVSDTIARETLVALKQIDLDLSGAIDITWEFRKAQLISREDWVKFDRLAVKTNAAVRTARDAVFQYLKYKQLGLEAGDPAGYLALAQAAYSEVRELKDVYEERRSQ